MRVLLTGASGLLGNNVLEVLLQKGHHVTALLRGHSVVSVNLAPYNGLCSIVRGNIASLDDLRVASEGCDALVNCAGVTDMSFSRQESYNPINRDLCTTLMQVAEERGMEVLVHVSTANTIGYGTPEAPSDESSPMQFPFTRSLYAKSKSEGEKLLIAASANSGCRVVILNPGYIIGKYDSKPSSGKILQVARRRRIMVAPMGGKSFVSVRTVADMVVAALERGRAGERYLATGENLSFKEFYDVAASVGGYRQRVLMLPSWLVRMVGLLGDFLQSIGLKVSFSTRNVEQLLVNEYYSNAKALKEFGVSPQPISEAIAEFFDFADHR